MIIKNEKLLNLAPLPGEIEGEFRRALGRHNLHLNLLEICFMSFEENLGGKSDKQKYIRQLAKQFRFHSLHPENASLLGAHNYLFLSHIAYVFSAGDALCRKVRSNSYIKQLKNEDTPRFIAIDKGDTIAKTVALAMLASMPGGERTADQVLTRTKAIFQEPCFSVVNYYRLVRNEELHAVDLDSDKKAADVWEMLPKTEVERLYGSVPNVPTSLAASDALMCSKAWQDVAKWLCRHIINDDECVLPMLERRFGKDVGARRETAARNFMKQLLLYSDRDVGDTIAKLKW